MALKDIAYTILLMSVFINTLLFAYGVISPQTTVFDLLLTEGQKTQLVTQSINNNLTDDSQLIDTSFGESSSSASTGSGNDFIPFVGELIGKIGQGVGVGVNLVLIILSYPSWIIQAMDYAGAGAILKIFLGIPLFLLQYFAVFYLISDIISIVKGIK